MPLFENQSHFRAFLSFACTCPNNNLDERARIVQMLPLQFQAAAVLMPFDWHSGAPQVWLTTRSSRLRHHTGQVAFPGGKTDAADLSSTATALRETEEELGVAVDDWDIIGNIPECYVPSGFVVSPIVALPRHTPHWQPNPDEVDNVFAVPLECALDSRCYRTQILSYHDHPMTVYELPFAHHHIWGATASMLLHMAHSYRIWTSTS